MQNSQEYFSPMDIDFVKEEPEEIPDFDRTEEMIFMRTQSDPDNSLEDPLKLASEKNPVRTRNSKNSRGSGKCRQAKTATVKNRRPPISRSKQQPVDMKRDVTLSSGSKTPKQKPTPDKPKKTELLITCTKCFSKFKNKLAMDIHECIGPGFTNITSADQSHSENEIKGRQGQKSDSSRSNKRFSRKTTTRSPPPSRKRNAAHFSISSENQGKAENASELPAKISRRGIRTGRPSKPVMEKIMKPKQNIRGTSASETRNKLRRENQNILGVGTGRKLYKCFECNEMFKRTEGRESHMKISHPEIQASFKCDECPKEFYRSHALNIHKNTTHMAKKIYGCQYCEEKFHSKVTLSAHEKTHSVSEDQLAYICQFCSKGFPTRLQLEKHERQAIHTDERAFKCPHCPQDFKKKGSLQNHLKTHNPNPADGIQLCKECGKEYSSVQALRLHEQRHNRPFQCDLCQKTFTSKILLDDHANIHTGETPYECTYCDKSFSTNSSLKEHVRVTHGPPLQGKHKCHCGLTFVRAARLAVHQQIHTGQKPFTCEKCGKGFTTKAHMLYHDKMFHSEGAPKSKATYKHSGKKDFPCGTCGKKFVSLEAVRYHEERTHSSQKELPFVCTVCGKGFQRSYFLEVHMRIHTGEKPFACTMCRTSFRSKESLGIHLKKTHGVSNNPGPSGSNENSEEEF